MTNANGFRVINEDDVNNYLSDKERFALNHLQSVIALGRESDNKPNTDEYLVVNTNAPYADKIMTIINHSDGLTATERFVNKQIEWYLYHKQITLTDSEHSQLKTVMWYSLTSGNLKASWIFNQETFSYDMAQGIATIKENRTEKKQ